MYFPLFVGVKCLSLFFYALLCVHSRFTIIFKRKWLLLSYRCLVTVNVLWLFLTLPWVGLQCVTVVFPDHTHFIILTYFLNQWKEENDRRNYLRSISTKVWDQAGIELTTSGSAVRLRLYSHKIYNGQSHPYCINRFGRIHYYQKGCTYLRFVKKILFFFSRVNT